VVRRAMSALELQSLIEVRLLHRTPGGVRARLRLDLVQDQLILSDRRFARPDPRALRLPAGDVVYPPGGDSAILADVIAALGGERVLDLCTGSGVQGLVAARRAGHVWMTDINPRAAMLARANASLNGVDNATVSVGNLFAPMRDARFDLLIANPPFVPGPRRGPAYHSGGPRGDAVLRRIVAGAGDHLRSGGRTVVISHLALRQGETVAAALEPHLTGFPGRVLILTLESGKPVDLAAAQAVFALHRGLAAYAREVREWVGYLRRHRVVQIVALLIVGERRGSPQIDVVDGSRRVLPIPLSRSPRENVVEWLGAP